MNFSNYSLKFTMKSCLLYEELTGKNFFKIATDEETIYAMYCAFIVNNGINITFSGFLNLLEEKKVNNWFSAEYEKLGKFMAQFNKEEEEPVEEGEKQNTEKKELSANDAVTALIFQYHLDPHYVMKEMELWELAPFLKAANSQYKLDMAEKRLWTYLTVIPHIDHKKCKSPEKLLPFPWEKEDRQKRAADNLKNNMYAVTHTIGKELNI